MGSLIVQALARGARGPESVRSEGPELRVGRGFANDLILGDPYVAPEQLRLVSLEGCWKLEVLDHTNPVLLNGRPVSNAVVPVNSGDRLTVGRSELLLFAGDHPVEATRKLFLSAWLAPNHIGPLLAIGILIIGSAFDVLADYAQTSVDLKWEKFGYTALFSAAITACWAGLWAVVGKVLRHQPNFFVQLLVTTLVSIGITVVYPFFEMLEFWTGSITIGKAANYAVALGGLTVLLRLNLFFATNLRHPTQVAFIIGAFVLGMVFAIERYNAPEFESDPKYSKKIWPPLLHVTPNQTIDGLLQSARQAVEGG